MIRNQKGKQREAVWMDGFVKSFNINFIFVCFVVFYFVHTSCEFFGKYFVFFAIIMY